ncbi:MAG: response regulator [Chlamydiota bacterium]|nr:response regulator [Chlamydiota bacterium]
MVAKTENNKILIIDDDEQIVSILQEFLQHRNYRVFTAKDVSNIDKIVSDASPDLIFLDYRMSPYTGKDILEKITLHHDAIPVVMMSAYRTVDGIFEVGNLGALDYIAKPFDFDEIDSILKKVFP